MMRRLLLFAVACGLWPPASFADIVHLKSGGKVEGRVVEKGDKLEIQTPSGTVTVAKDDVLRVEKKDFAAPARPAKKDVRLGPTYAHPFLAFKIWLPPKWMRGKESGAATMSFYGPKDQFYHPRMDLRIDTSAKDLAEYVRAYKDAFRKAFADASFLFEEASGVRGRTAYQFCVLFNEGEPAIPQQALFTFVAEGNRKVVLSFNCTQAWFERFYGQIDASMRSLRLYPAPAPSTQEKQRFLTAYNRGEQAYRESRWAEALEDFREAAGVLPDFADLQTTLGSVNFRLGRHEDAEAAYRKAIAIDPDDATPHYNLGLLLLKQSKFDPAIAAFKRAVELEPASEPALSNLGAAYLGRGLDALAKETLEKAVALDPESAAAHFNLGLSYERLDRKKDAEREFKETLSADPKHAEAQKALERLKARK
jgi:tetratricopeptide (TPR) repeat protein